MLYCGGCEAVLPLFLDNSVDAIVTDPPYGLRFMGKRWDYDVPSVEIWREGLRVLKPGGHLLSFGGTRTYHRMVVNIEDAGFEIRDQIDWLYGSGFPKSLNIGKAVDKLQGNEREVVGKRMAIDITGDAYGSNNEKANDGRERLAEYTETKGTSEWEGWGTALKPAHEPICMARKPIEGTVAGNVLKWGTGGINVDGCRVALFDGSKREHKNKYKPGAAIQMYANGEYEKPNWYENPNGRFPANVIHDGSDEVVGLFPVTGKSQGGRSGHTGAYGGGYNQEYYGDEKPGFGDSGSAARFFYCAKASRAERGEGNNHPTVKPLKLMEYLVTLITPPGGTVLDPFMGGGTTGLACRSKGFGFIGIEKDPASFEIAKRRYYCDGLERMVGE